MSGWWLKLIPYSRPQRGGLALVMLLMLIGVALDTLKPWPLKLLVDHVLEGEPLPAAVAWLTVLPGAGSAAALVGWLAGGTLVLFLGRQTIGTIQEYVRVGVGTRIACDLGGASFGSPARSFLRLP